MSNGNKLNINRSLELLANLKQTAAKFAKREEQINRDVSARRAQSARKNQDATRHTDAQLNDAVTRAEARHKEDLDHIKAVFEKRRTRVQKFTTNTLRNLPHRAQEEKRRWMGDLQMKNFLAQKKLDAGLAAAEGVYSNFTGKLDINQASLKELEKRSRKAFAGYGVFKRMLRRKAEVTPEHFNDLGSHFAAARQALDEFEEFALPRFFAAMPLAVLIIIALGVGAGVAAALHTPPLAYIGGGVVAVLLIAVAWFIHDMGMKKARPSAIALSNAMVTARAIMAAGTAAVTGAAGSVDKARQEAQQQFDTTSAEIQRQWTRADSIEEEFQTRTRNKVNTQGPRIIAKIDRIIAAKTAQIDADRARRLERFTGEATGFKQQYSEVQNTEAAAVAADEKIKWDEITTDWQKEIVPIYNAIEETNAISAAKFPAWSHEFVKQWEPSIEFMPAAQFGRLDLDLTKQQGGLPRDPRLALPGPSQVSLPAALSFPDHGSILFETHESAGGRVTGVLNNIILRLLAITPPGKLSFTIIDPVGLGESFAGLMHLADYEESIINRRIWTQRDQIEERLAELSEHIEKVIQMYLRNEYATITEYNEKAGSVAEKYHFLVVADFPANFSEVAAKRLQSIAASGPRCGVFTLIHWDQRQALPEGLSPDDLRNSGISIRRTGDEFTLTKQPTEAGATLSFENPPAPELAVELSHKIGKASIDSNRVEVPFTQIAPKPDEMWTCDTTNELRVAVGRTGATKLQYLAIGKGTRQHALFAGKTGSGKSTLFHVIITNLALSCSPDQVEFYLIDFKKGVEFKCYASKHLPHAKVVAIESDREFALSVLQRVDAELKRRGDMFRKLGVQDVAGYKRAGGTEPMPRSLLLIDEFQEFFVEDDTVAQTASLLFDRIVRQGRAFGIHVLLGSQTLGGAYSLARATLGQMVIRVALQCNEADAYLIMDENNSAPRLLSRPGEGIYNDAAGAMEGNSPFQVVWLSDDERDAWLDKVNTLMTKHPEIKYSTPIVFEGNAPANIDENDLLRDALASTPTLPPVPARGWLGAPNSIKGPTEATFQRQSGSHLLIVGQREEASLNMVGMMMLSLAAQYPKGAAKFVVLGGTVPGSSEEKFLNDIIASIPHEVIAPRGQDIGGVISDLAAELKTRSTEGEGSGDAPATFLFIHGLQKYKKLRYEDDFSFSSSSDSAPNPGAQFNEIISEGASVGIHIIAAVDTLNSVNRFMNRKALTEFEMRVVFQMSANDSASLIDSPKASNLGLHRAIYFNEHEGTVETFRPYATPDSEWIRQSGEKLRLHHAKVEDAAVAKS